MEAGHGCACEAVKVQMGIIFVFADCIRRLHYSSSELLALFSLLTGVLCAVGPIIRPAEYYASVLRAD